MSGGLGFIPLIVAGVSLLAQKKAGDDAAGAASTESRYAAAYEDIAAGRAVSPLALMTAQDKATLRRAWPTIRVAAKWSDINWPAIGWPRGPQLSAGGAKAIEKAFPEVRSAAQFDDINWQFVAIPMDLAAQYAPSQFGPVQQMLGPVLDGSGNRKLILAAGIAGAAILLGLSLRN